ncbi:hypothetical protein IK110_02155 [Candidatus Saccharibacteria bacterium]|nr:hypothetical protein [Candidatus Saccharibacteria bacterium]
MSISKRKIFRVSLVASSLVIAFAPIYRSYALSEEYLDKFSANNIMFYNPEECAGTTTSSTGLVGSNTKEKMWNFFRSKGLNEAQTAGVLGNAYVESYAFNAAARNSSGAKYWGLFQYNFEYAADMYQQIKDANLYKYVEEYTTYGGAKGDEKIPAADLDKLIEIELNYAWDKWNPTWKEKIQGNVGDEHEVEWAAEVFLVHFEGASPGSYTLKYYNHGGTWQGAPDRRTHAREIYEELKGSTVVNGASFSSNYKGVDQCCDPNAAASSAGIYPGTTYDLSEGQIKGITAMAVAENGTSEAGVKSEASLMANLFEYKKPSSKGSASGLVNYLKTSGWFSTANQYSESYNGSSAYIEAVKDVLVNGNRTLPAQIVEHDCFTSACGAGIGSATNNGTEIDLNDKSQFKRGITVLHQSGGGLNGSYIFWDWADPEKKIGDPFGYFENNPPAEGLVNATTGTSSAGIAGSNTLWKQGWITNGLSGYVKDEANGTTLSGISTNFGKSFTTKLPKDSETNGPNKITFDITKSGNSGGGKAINLYAGNPYPPHFTVDLKNHRTFQHGNILYTAAAMGESGDNNAAGVQVTIIGFNGASDVAGWDLTSDDNFSDEDWMYLGELLASISVETGISLGDSLDLSKVGDAIAKKIKAGISAYNASQNLVCSGGAGDYTEFYNLLVKIAYPKYTSKDSSDNPSSPMPYYAELVQKTSYSHGGCNGQDCGGFVGLLVRESGLDPDYQPSGTDAQLRYVKGSDKWKNITSDVLSDDSNVNPADVLITDEGHTLIYVGDVPDSNWDKGAKFASASLCERWPMAQNYSDGQVYKLIHEGESWGTHRKYEVFRRVGQ